MAITVLTTQPAFAKSAAELAKTCQSLVGYLQVSCLAYIGGALDSHRHLVAAAIIPPIICIPELKDVDRKVVVVDWMKRQKHPLSGTAIDAIYKAFSERYPCPVNTK